MNIKNILTVSCLCAAYSAYSQTDSSEMWQDTMMIMEDPPAIMNMEDYPEAPTEPYIQYSGLNKFRFNKKLKPEERPDKKAAYYSGSGGLMTDISNNLNIPYSANDENLYVILSFVVGKDSLLYNPEIMYTPGAPYSINATDAVEKLQNQFTPAMKNGKPVDSIILVPIRFSKKYYTYDYNE